MAKEMTQQERRQEAIRSVQEQFDARPPRGAGCGEVVPAADQCGAHKDAITAEEGLSDIAIRPRDALEGGRVHLPYADHVDSSDLEHARGDGGDVLLVLA